MMLQGNSKSKVSSPDGDTYSFIMGVRVFQGQTLEPFLFMIFLDNLLDTSVVKIFNYVVTFQKLAYRISLVKIT